MELEYLLDSSVAQDVPAVSGDSSDAAPDTPSREAAGSDEPWFDADSLATLDFSAGEIDHIEEVWGRSVMQQLELADQRARTDERSHAKALRDHLQVHAAGAGGARRRSLRRDALCERSEEPGDPGGVVDDSPGAIAGVEPGDVVVSYAGERVFAPRDLNA